MRKLYFLLAFFISGAFMVFSGPGAQTEEIDYLLFLPDSGNQFVNDEQANIQLDKIAGYLKTKNLAQGQIVVYGYAAFASSGSDPVNLSRERALFVVNKLQKRGVPADLFSEPVANGAVNLWGDNASEESKSPNRRVRITASGTILTPAKIVTPEPAAQTAAIDNTPKEQSTGSDFRFNWMWLIPLLLIAFLAIFALKRRKKSGAIQPAEEAAPLAETTRQVTVDLENEIRRYAYELYTQRGAQNGDADSDWYAAVVKICSLYNDDGYTTGKVNGRWQAVKTVRD